MDNKSLENLTLLLTECLVDSPDSHMGAIRNYHQIRVLLDEVMDDVIQGGYDYYHAKGIEEGRGLSE